MAVMLPPPRRRPYQYLVSCLVGLLVLLLYYYSIVQLRDQPSTHPLLVQPTAAPLVVDQEQHRHQQHHQQQDSCQHHPYHQADIETAQIFPKLNLDPSWLQRREFWSNQYEDRYQKRKRLWPQLPLRVIVMPHSHNDPGWLKTVEGYFATATKSILTNIVNKLTQHANMTFIWSEINYLSMWWESADAELRDQLRRLLASGRLEITTGGWIMTDEAVVDLFSMIDQLVEGHAFLRRVMDIRPANSWSVDSFGHGAAFPHLLSLAGIDNLVVMRTHYAWKEWLARHQQGTFRWIQPWQQAEAAARAPLCLNFPYDIYSIKHSCGPSPQTCLGFDFRHLAGEHNEFTLHYTPIDEKNLATRAELLLDQYGRTGSLFPHNVVLVPLGDDFRYSNELEFDQQYENYMKLMGHINSHHNIYHAHVSFGTLTDYFREVRSRMSDFSTLSGDFHVYSDIFTEGRPAYWSGYYVTRPWVKLLGRQVSSRLRDTEILYTVASGLAANNPVARSILAAQFGHLEAARRDLGLFQHHDAITGTAKAFVMRDYEEKLGRALQDLNRVEALLLGFMMLHHNSSGGGGSQKGGEEEEEEEQLLLLLDDKRRRLVHLNPRNKGEQEKEERVLNFASDAATEYVIVVYSALSQDAERMGRLRSSAANVCIYDDRGATVETQVMPVFTPPTTTTTKRKGGAERLNFTTPTFDIWFTVILKPVSLTALAVRLCDKAQLLPATRIYCLRCRDRPNDFGGGLLQFSALPPGALQLENQLYRLLFDEETRLLATLTNKISGVAHSLQLSFSAYKSDSFRSGAYLFSVERDPATGLPVRLPVFTPRHLVDVVVVTGRLLSEVRLVFVVPPPPTSGGGSATFVHTVRLNQVSGPLGEAVHIENSFDLGPDPSLRDRELVMRLQSDLLTADGVGVPADGRQRHNFYTDRTGLGYGERIWTPEAGIEGNYFPITEGAYLQDATHRLSLLVDHSTGATSPRPGALEVGVDKRTAYDDGRGMGEGVLDSRHTRHRYILIMEPAAAAGAEHLSAASAQQQLSDSSTRLPALSPLAMTLAGQLENPLSIFLDQQPRAAATASTAAGRGAPNRTLPEIGLLSAPLPCDYNLVNLRSWGPLKESSDEAANALLILRRLAPDCAWASLTVPDCAAGAGATLAAFDAAPKFQLAHHPGASYASTSLTGNFAAHTLSISNSSSPAHRRRHLFDLTPMEIAAYNVTFT